jgi:methylmalonyl-CoA mutase C-terminal domain/subunit
MSRPYRVVLAKPGLDGHEAGIKLVARGLRDAGFEVIYMGARQRPASIVGTALQEDADVIGVSILTGGHLLHSKRLLATLRAAGADDIPLIVGGIIPPAAASQMKELGVAAVFGPGDSLKDIVACIRSLCERRGTEVATAHR